MVPIRESADRRRVQCMSPGSATASLTISNLTIADAGNYTLSVSKFGRRSASATVVLTVMVPPAITLQPVGRSVPPGLPTIFNAASSGIPTPAYQKWRLNGTNIPEAQLARATPTPPALAPMHSASINLSPAT